MFVQSDRKKWVEILQAGEQRILRFSVNIGMSVLPNIQKHAADYIAVSFTEVRTTWSLPPRRINTVMLWCLITETAVRA
jgi:hypothetical protein